MTSPILAEIMLREQTPLSVRLGLLVCLLVLAFFYVVNRSWATSLRLLSLLPFQKFGWQSEKYGSDHVFRLTSFASIVGVTSLAVHGYQLGQRFLDSDDQGVGVVVALGVVLLLFALRFVLNVGYFKMHDSQKMGEQVVDFLYAVNQWFSLAALGILLLDFFYYNLDSPLLTVLSVLTIIYFLVKLFGTIVILQNNFSYPILSVFVYLCTFEIVPALVVVKVLFVNT